MSKVQKITLSASRDIPFNKLTLSQANIRRVKAGVSIEELAEDIARRTLLQGLSVRPVLDSDGNETGMFEVPAGGRRFRALELLVKQKRMAKTQPVPCVVRESGLAEEDSLAENLQREALHPLDQFRAFKTLCDKGVGEEEIAARFFVTPAVVKQRLKLAAVSPKLLNLYAEDEMTLEQLMAFTVTHDHARQEQVWETIAHTHNTAPYAIRRQLTEGAVRASDRRARFVGIEAYEAAGGVVMRDLFQHDDGGWLQDPALLDRLATDKLKEAAESTSAEGWKWIAVAADFPYGHSAGLRQLTGETIELSEDEQARRDALQTEFDQLERKYAEADELPDEVDQRLGEIETALAAFDERPMTYDPAEITRAGVFISIDSEGRLRIERGFVRPEDEAPRDASAPAENEESDADGAHAGESEPRSIISGAPAEPDDDESDSVKPLSERLVIELTAHRTLALRDALANDPNVAFTAILHALCLDAFYHVAWATCLEISAKSTRFAAQAPGLADSVSAKAIETRHQQWKKRLPANEDALWDALIDLDGRSQAALLAHCVSLSVNAVCEPWNRNARRLAHAEVVARAVNLDMATAGWTATVNNYLGRVPKALILEAVREAKGEHAAERIDHLKKADMAKEAERLLDGTGWLPALLRTHSSDAAGADGVTIDHEETPSAFPNDEQEAASDLSDSDLEPSDPHAVAAA